MDKKGLVKDIIIVVLALAVVSLVYTGWSKGYLNFGSKNESSVSTQQDQNEIAGWKTYTNEKYGFEFKYPKDLNLVIDEASFKPEYTSTIAMFRLIRPGSIEDNYKMFINEGLTDIGDLISKSQRFERIKVDSKDATRLYFGSYSSIFIPVQNLTFGFINNIKEPDPVFESILTSFKFIK